MEPLRVNARLVLPPGELRVSYARAGGPGGQHVNKTETKVVLRFSIARSRVLGERRKSRLFQKLSGRLTAAGELVVHASRYRSRARNLEDARERMAGTLRAALAVPKARRRTRPTRGSVERRLSAKKHRARTKQDRRKTQE